MLGLKGRNLHVEDSKGDFLKDGHMVVTNAAGDAAPLQHLGHHAHRAVHATMATADGRIKAAHVVVVGMSKQYPLDHIGTHTVALQLGKRLVERDGRLILGILFLAVIFDRLPDARIDEDAAARRAQLGAVTAAAAAETDKAQSFPHTSIARLSGRIGR